MRGHNEIGDGLAKSAETPKELFAKCEANARVADRKAYERALSLLAGVLTFQDHLFGRESHLDAPPSTGDSHSVKLRRIIQQASRYRDLVRWLKEYPAREQRWLLLALWLNEEGICDPMAFLPAQVYENLTGEKRAALRVSIADVQHYCRVEAWRPYFERLLSDRLSGKDLAIAGYDEQAIVAAQKSRAAVPAACAWLAMLFGGRPDATTLRNAYSRMSSKAHHKSPGCGL